MSILTFPLTKLPPHEFWWEANTHVFESPFSRTTQTLQMPGGRWRGKLSYGVLFNDDRHRLEAFLIALNGASGRFYFTPFQASLTQSVAILKNYPQASVTQGYRTNIMVNGLPINTPNFLHAHSFFSVQLPDGGEQMVTTSGAVSIDASGVANIYATQPFRSIPAAGAQVRFLQPRAIFRLVDDAQAKMSIGKLGIGSADIEFVEVWR